MRLSGASMKASTAIASVAKNLSAKCDWKLFLTPGFALSASRPKRRRRLENSRYRDVLWLLLPAAIIILADQISKFWAVEKLSDGSSISVIGDFFMLTLVYNRGGALGTNFASSDYYLISSLFILIIVIYYAYINRSDRPLALPLALITGGAIGNVIDRIRIGKVIDFLDFDFFDIDLFGYRLERWWTFNIADSAISCSIVFLLVFMMLRPKQETDLPEENQT